MGSLSLSKPALTARQLRLGILYNGHSGDNRKNPGAFSKFQQAHPQIAHHEVRTPEEVADALGEFARQGINVVAVNGGDGTVQAVLSALLQRNAFEALPLVAPLCAGTSNMTAADVGVRGTPTKALARLLAWIQKGGDETAIVTRPILRLQIAPEAAPLFGMFFGTGLIYPAIQYSRQHLHPLGLHGAWGERFALLRFLIAMIRRDEEIIAPTQIEVSLDGQPLEKQECIVLLVSTLERLLPGVRPYWGREPESLRYTCVQAYPKHLVRSLPSLLRGKQNKYMTPEHGYISRNVSEIRLDLKQGFTLDGEMFTPEEARGSLVLSEGGQVSFIHL